MPYNESYTPFIGTATVTFSYDSNLVYLYSMNPQPVHDAVAHTLTWSCTNLPSPGWDWSNYRFENFFHVPAGLSPGYLLQSDFDITPDVGDCSTGNNHQHYSELVTGSHDPNEKTVSPEGFITANDSVLTYTIHFQNTGTDTTHFVTVLDTLSPYLNPVTVVNLASSADYSEFNLSGTGILKWVFNPCFLPDSATNEPASKGFVMFSIKVKPNLPAGTIIENKSSIYFDYNTPVVTNTVSNTFITGMSQLAVDSMQLAVYPNPAESQLTVSSTQSAITEIKITDVLGRETYQSKNNLKSEIINLKSFSPGIYFIRVQLQDGSAAVRKFVKE